jgi:hypothetical protein
VEKKRRSVVERSFVGRSHNETLRNGRLARETELLSFDPAHIFESRDARSTQQAAAVGQLSAHSPLTLGELGIGRGSRHHGWTLCGSRTLG